MASTQHSAADSRDKGYEHFSNDYDVDDFSVDVKSTSSRFRPAKMGSKGMSTNKVVLISILVAAVGIGLGVIIGWFSSQANFPEVTEPSETFKVWEAALAESDETEVTNMILEEMNAENIREFLR